MSLFRLSFLYFKSRPLQVVLSMLLLILGIGLMVSLQSINRQLKDRLDADAEGIGLVVGAKGSPLMLILCNVFHIEFPTGNIDLTEAMKVADHRFVKKAIPLSLGDSYRTYRIVGTNHDYPAHFEAQLGEGRLWESIEEVTVGAHVARQLGISIGDELVSDHGFAEGIHAHEEHGLEVVGILEETHSILDELILTSLESYWLSHEQIHVPHDYKVATKGFPSADSLQITSMLLTYSSPMGALQLPNQINTQTNMQAASPAFESARLFERLGVGVAILQSFAILVMVVAGLSIFLSLLNIMKDRRYDLAMMRSMGAGRFQVLLLVLLESIWITGIGGLLGLVVGHGLVEVVGHLNETAVRLGVSSTFFLPQEGYFWLGAIVLGLLASLLPAWQAYRLDISDTLAKGS